MKKLFKFSKLFIALFIIFQNFNVHADVFGKSQFLPRSQGARQYRHLVGIIDYYALNSCSLSDWQLQLNVEYNQTWDNKKLGKYFSFKKKSDSFIVGPDTTPPSNGTDTNFRNADLGLSETFKSKVKLTPSIRTVVIEPTFYKNLDCLACDTWFQVIIPVTWAEWKMKCNETVENPGGTMFQAGFVSTNATPVGATKALTAFAGNSKFGDNTTGLQKCKIICGKKKKWGVADLRTQLGWSFINCPDKHAGFYFLTVAPTGNAPKSEQIFEPRIGLGHWQAGGGLYGDALFWESCKGNTTLHGFAEFYTTHVFKRRRSRCLDLKANDIGSKYLLLKEFDSNGMYNNNLINFANVFTVQVKTKFAWLLEGTFGLQLNRNCWSVVGGYNIWAREKEQFDCKGIRLDSCNPQGFLTAEGKQYGVKGLENATNNDARPASTITTDGIQKSGNERNLITENNVFARLDFENGAIPRAVSHTFFVYAQYIFDNCEYPAFIGLGGTVEIGQKNNALNTWGVWAKFGCAYC